MIGLAVRGEGKVPAELGFCVTYLSLWGNTTFVLPGRSLALPIFVTAS